MECYFVLSGYFNGIHAVPDVSGPLAKINGPVNGFFDCFCIHFFSIMKGDILSQPENPLGAIFIGYPIGGKQWFNLIGPVIVAGQGFIYIVKYFHTVRLLRTWI